jgi:thiamine-phosphate pyrophosphorylase
LVRHVREVMAIATPQAAVIVNDRVDVALSAGADGVHVGQDDLTVAQARAIAGRNLIVGVSTHDESEARAAVEAGADYCGLGAMFATSLKPDRTPSGPEYARWFIERYSNVPHLAIGGITAANLPQLVNVGVRGIAVSTAVCAADEPNRITRDLCETLRTRDAPSRAR